MRRTRWMRWSWRPRVNPQAAPVRGASVGAVTSPASPWTLSTSRRIWRLGVPILAARITPRVSGLPVTRDRRRSSSWRTPMIPASGNPGRTPASTTCGGGRYRMPSAVSCHAGMTRTLALGGRFQGDVWCLVPRQATFALLSIGGTGGRGRCGVAGDVATDHAGLLVMAGVVGALGPIPRRCWCEHQQMNRPAPEENSMAGSAHGTVRGGRLARSWVLVLITLAVRLAGRRWSAIATLHRPRGGVTWPAYDTCC
jgi:hypothetical protein